MSKAKDEALAAVSRMRPWPWSGRAVRRRVHPLIEGPSLTQQEFKDQCDINHQIALFTRAGRPLPAYGEDASIEYVQDLNATYIEAITSIREVEDAFSKLPAKTRAKFDNSPLKMAQYLHHHVSLQEAIDLGILAPPDADDGAPSQPPSSPAKPSPKAPEEPKAKPPAGAE